MIRSCPACGERSPSHSPEPLLSDPLPSRPFENTAADRFHTSLVYTDRYSGWPAVSTTGRTATSSDVIYLLNEWRTDKSIPNILKTDGGQQFASQAFSDFCRQLGIHHVISSPHHHEANGAANGCAEAVVKAMKVLVAKTTTTGRIDVDEFRSGLLEFWIMLRAHGFSPAQLLYGRTLCFQLLTQRTALKQEWREQRNALDKAATSLMAKAKTQHDEHTRPSQSLPLRSCPCATPTHQAVGHNRRSHRGKA